MFKSKHFSTAFFESLVLTFGFKYITRSEKEEIIQRTIKIWSDFKNNSPSFSWKLKKDEKTQSFPGKFIKVPAELISLNPLQKQRFFVDKNNQILLFHSKARQDTFDLMMKLIKENNHQIMLRGPRGVGKSHLLSSFCLNLKARHPDKYSIFYINNPNYYFLRQHDLAIFKDMCFFLTEELIHEKENPNLKRKLCELNLINFDSLMNFLIDCMNEKTQRGLINLVFIDQNNILDRKKLDNPDVYRYMITLMTLAQSILSASNNNETISEISSQGSPTIEIELDVKNCIGSDQDALTFMKESELFQNVFKNLQDTNNPTLQAIKRITNYNPYEIQKLSSVYQKENLELEDQCERLEENYYEKKKMEIMGSHWKFMNECCPFSEAKTTFFNCLHLMDTNDVILDQMEILIDQNLI